MNVIQIYFCVVVSGESSMKQVRKYASLFSFVYLYIEILFQKCLDSKIKNLQVLKIQLSAGLRFLIRHRRIINLSTLIFLLTNKIRCLKLKERSKYDCDILEILLRTTVNNNNSPGRFFLLALGV